MAVKKKDETLSDGRKVRRHYDKKGKVVLEEELSVPKKILDQRRKGKDKPASRVRIVWQEDAALEPRTEVRQLAKELTKAQLEALKKKLKAKEIRKL